MIQITAIFQFMPHLTHADLDFAEDRQARAQAHPSKASRQHAFADEGGLIDRHSDVIGVEQIAGHQSSVSSLSPLADPLAALAQTQEQIHERLREITPIDDAELKALWDKQAQELLQREPPEGIKEIAEQFLILVTCRDEKEQVELLGRFQVDGLKCKPLVA